MKSVLGFGKNQLMVNIEDNNVLGVLEPNKVETNSSGIDAVKFAIENPIGSKRLKDIVNPTEKIVIITSDITRPMPSKLVLPEILREVYSGGVCPEDITIVFSLGSHRKHTEDEKKYLLGEEIFSKIKCLDSDVKDFVSLGKTSRRTPVDIFRPVVEADRVICLGNIEYHYFAGYSGGAKAIMPGVSTREAIQSNHSMMVDEFSYAGELERNPVRQDIEEVEKFIKIDFILNVVLDEKKNIIKAVAGDYVKAHREGCKFLDSIYKVRIPKKTDIVVVSAGGYPKDINLYQAQKALDNAKHAVRKGGIIILVASCKEEFGEDVFKQWMLNSSSPGHMVERIKVKFELGGHKAAAIGLVLQNARIFLVSELPDDLVRRINFEPFSNVNDALDKAFSQIGPEAKVLLMPYGGSTLPFLES